MINMKKNDKVYFAASNTGHGFVNYFADIFGSDERIYILKGGPGTGKSHFLRSLGREAENRGIYCEKYLCSSDPDSLDGIRIPSMGVSVFDGTAPHAADPMLPGASDEILNLGQFWESGILRTHKENIAALSEKKKDAYAAALAMLRLAAECMQHQLTLLAPYLYRDKMKKTVERFLAKLEPEKGRVIPRPLRTYGMKGEKTLATFTKDAETILVISPLYGVEYLYLQELLMFAKEQGIGVEYAPHPLLPALPEAVMFPASGVLVSAMPGDTGKILGTRRFLDSAVFPKRGKLLRFLVKATDTMTQGALDMFAEMREYHFALEAIYGTAMDFEKKEAYCKAFIEKLFQNGG